MRSPVLRTLGTASALLAAILPGGAAADPPAMRWTAATPDEMVDQLLARARRGGDDALAAMALSAALDDRASFGRVREGFTQLAASGSPFADDAAWARKRLLPAPASPPWTSLGAVQYDAPPSADGLLRSFAVLGPFQDAGGGLMRREGPEDAGERWNDGGARYARGVYDVAWRRTLPSSTTARGLPLDLYVHPRQESCTYLGSRITVPAGTRAFVVRVAAAGAVRLVWDAVDVAASEELHPHAVFDRLAARVEAAPGDHLLGLKLCSGAVTDAGRVRVRFTDEQGKALALAASSDLKPLSASAATRPADAAPVKKAAPAPAAGKKGKAAKKAELEPAPAAPQASAIVPPKGIARVPTALEKALEVGEAPTTERALAAAVLRTMGGADDARSPRAPGLLDRVAKAADVTADQLALAGWISPFGANRSGWLNLARSRAAEKGDAASAAFAQRRLVAAHLASRYVDWAIAAAGEEPLKSATDPEARLIRALVKKQLGAGGFGRAALEEMLGIEASERDKTPLAVLHEALTLSPSQPELQLRLARRLAASAADHRASGFVNAHRTEGAEAVERAAAEVLGQQTRVEDLTHIGNQLLHFGRHAWAREVFHLVTQLAPNRSAGFAGLASAREAIRGVESREGKPHAEDASFIEAALRRAQELEPGDAALKAELALRTGSAPEGDGPAARTAQRDEQYLVKPEVFLARGQKNPARKGEIADRQLHWLRVVTYHADKRVSQLMHYAREVVIEPRTEQDQFEGLPQEGDENEVLLARVHRKDGTLAQPEEQGSGRRPYVRWPELKTGDVVEVVVRSWTSGPVGRRGEAPFWFIDYVGATDSHPILYNEVVIDSPEGSPLAIDILHGAPDRTETTKKDGRVVSRYAWDKPPILADEPFAPKPSEVLPVVVGSTFKSWADFREWYRAAVQGFTEPDDQVRRMAAELTKGKKTRDEKLKAIFEFVADDIRYVNYVSGEWWLPNRPQELLARRQGDCDDKAMLLITLLKAIGIEANEVLVQTRYTAQPSLLRAEKAAIPLFDHGIAYLPGEKGKPGIWLDATSPESRLGPLPSMDARTVAFFIDEGPAKVIDTPPSSPDEHGVDARWTITLSPSGAGDLSAEERHSGDAAFELRTSLKQPDARHQWVEQYLAQGWFPTVQVTGEVDFVPDLPKGAAILKYGAHSEGFARREGGGELAISLAEANTITSQLAPLVKRTLPVVLPARLAPGHETRTITILAPPGYAFAELPPDGEIAGGEFGKAKLTFKPGKGKGQVVATRSVLFGLDVIPVDKYAAWRGWLQRIDGLMHRTLRLVPDDKAPAPVKVAAKPKK
jgi:transglutaminase-like putative cysteine protease